MNILIVEDDAVSRKVITNKLFQLGECTAAKNGKEAIHHFERAIHNNTPFDLVILDISMPDMDGIEVLSTIRKKETWKKIKKSDQIKIIMVTATMRKSSIKKCISLGCNSYISKPFKTKKIYQEIERLGFEVPDLLKFQEKGQKSYTDLVARIIKRFNKGEIKLPVLPHIVKEVQAFVEGEDPSIDGLATVVEKDAVMSTKLISAANSALFKGVDKVSSLNDALVRLGLKTSLSVITAITSKHLFKSDNEELKLLLNQIWLHSLACASGAKLIAQELEDNSLDNVFLMGIIHDIGKVILLKAVSDIAPEEPLDDKSLLAAIQDVHTVFGAVLVKKWGFSKEHIKVVEHHHWTTFPKKTEKELMVIHVANFMAAKSGFSSFFPLPKDKNYMSPELLTVLKGLNLDPKNFDKLSETLTDAMVNLSDQF